MAAGSPPPRHATLTLRPACSALKDSRFAPITLDELPGLACSVSILSSFEPARTIYDWSPGVHGVRIAFRCPDTGKQMSATYLPEVAKEQGWNQEQTIRSLIHKSGFRGTVSRGLLRSIAVTRYQSSKTRVTYAQYCRYRDYK